MGPLAPFAEMDSLYCSADACTPTRPTKNVPEKRTLESELRKVCIADCRSKDTLGIDKRGRKVQPGQGASVSIAVTEPMATGEASTMAERLGRVVVVVDGLGAGVGAEGRDGRGRGLGVERRPLLSWTVFTALTVFAKPPASASGRRKRLPKNKPAPTIKHLL